MATTITTDNRTFLSPWLIIPEMLPDLMEKIRNPVPANYDQNALLSYSGKIDDDLNYCQRGDVAIVDVTGGLTLHANNWSYYYQWSVYKKLSLGFQELLDNPKIKTIIFVFDSPGGTVFGLEELVDLIYLARGKKRLIAFAQGYCTSAAYWIASAFDVVVASKGSFLGSIGSKIQFEDWSAYERRIGIVMHTYTSKQAPYKSPSPGTVKGDQLFQDIVDNTGAKFITGVSRNRGIDEQTILEKFGKGWILSSDRAVAVGMADYEASLEDVIQAVNELKGNEPLILNSTNEVDMFNEEQITEIRNIIKSALDENAKVTTEILEKLQANQEEIQQKLVASGEENKESPENKEDLEEPSQNLPDGAGQKAEAKLESMNTDDYKTKYEAAQKELEDQKAEIERLKNLPNNTDFQKEHGANNSDDSPGY